MSDLPPVWIHWPFARIRREITTDGGTVRQFVMQLEYDIQAEYSGQNAPEWRTVARFDHDPHLGQGHDIREEGLHLDIYRHEEKSVVRRQFPPVALDSAPRYCERFLAKNAERLLGQFEDWHDIDGPFRDYSEPYTSPGSTDSSSSRSG